MSKSTSEGRKRKVDNKQLKPARSKLEVAAAIAKQGAVQGLCPLPVIFATRPFVLSSPITKRGFFRT